MEYVDAALIQGLRGTNDDSVLVPFFDPRFNDLAFVHYSRHAFWERLLLLRKLQTGVRGYVRRKAPAIRAWGFLGLLYIRLFTV